jgi:hypothetical protein
MLLFSGGVRGYLQTLYISGNRVVLVEGTNDNWRYNLIFKKKLNRELLSGKIICNLKTIPQSGNV